MNASRRPSGASDRYVVTQNPPKLCPSTLQRSIPSSPRMSSASRDDRVGAEMREIGGLVLRRAPREPPDRGRAPGAALVEHQHTKVLQGPVEPGRRARLGDRARRLEAGAAGEHDQERPRPPVGIGPFARKHLDLAVLPAVWSSGTSKTCSVTISPGSSTPEGAGSRRPSGLNLEPPGAAARLPGFPPIPCGRHERYRVDTGGLQA